MKQNLNMKIGESRMLIELGRKVICIEADCEQCVYKTNYEPCANDFDESGHCFSSERDDEKDVCFKLCEE